MPGLLTLSQLEDEVRYAVDNRGDLPSPRIQNLINHIYLFVAHPSIYKHPQLETQVGIPMVADQVGYSFQPADPGFAGAGNLQIITLHDIVHVFGTSLTDFSVRRRRLRPWEIRRFDRVSGPRPQSPTPTRYAKWGAGIFLDVRPTGAAVGQLLQVRFYTQPPVLTAGATTLILPIWDWIIVKGAEWKVWSALGVPDLAEVAKQEFTTMVNNVTNIQAVEGEDPGRAIEVEIHDAMGPTP